MNMASSLPANSLTTKVPPTDASGTQTPEDARDVPRWATGTWSGSTAIKAASRALNNSCAMHHPTSTTATLGASATTRIPTDPPASPITIHGRRIPNLDVVRSLSRPNNGLPTIATSDPTAAMRDSWFGARSVPTSALTFSASVTSNGEISTRLVARTAAAYDDTKTQPTRSVWGAALTPRWAGSDRTRWCRRL